MNINHVFIVGRITKKPELKELQSGQKTTSFSVATTRTWSGKDGQKQEQTDFHNIVAWARTAEVITQYCDKGSLIAIEGRLQTRKWQDKGNVTHYSTEVVTESMQLGPKPQGTQSEASEKFPEKAEEEVVTIDLGDDVKAEDLPF